MKITKYYRHVKTTYWKTAFLIALAGLFLLPSYTKIEKTGNNVYEITLNGEQVGTVSDTKDADSLLWQARKEIAKEEDVLFLADAELSVTGREAYFAQFTGEDEIIANMKEVLTASQISTIRPAFTIKINQLMINLSSVLEVSEALQAALDQYQEGKQFVAQLGPDQTRELNVLTVEAKSAEEKKEEEKEEQDRPLVAGCTRALADMVKDTQAAKELTFDDFDYGLTRLSYSDQQQIYEVQQGDTLSEIAINCDIPLDKIIELNDSLEDENSMIRVGEELVVTSPEPALSIDRQEEVYYEEDYEADIQYVYNDDWYTTDTQILQQPSAGHRKVAALKSYHNKKETETEILKEEVTVAAVPKIIEKGTKIPPTYIKPISGGRLSSQFGRRKAPTKGASTYHKGVDWATPVGTKVVASSAGTVARAGWGSGYGYVVYINHADGRQTRYGHLSKVLVRVGDQVSQGQKIALSGNTGRSTGAHLHFEILIGGAQVNPLQYLN